MAELTGVRGNMALKGNQNGINSKNAISLIFFYVFILAAFHLDDLRLYSIKLIFHTPPNILKTFFESFF